MTYLAAFRMPTPMKITGRSSSITNAFINSIIPVVVPTGREVQRVLEIFEMDPDDLRCVYCGDVSSEWDHLNPLVKKQKPTGYISEIANLVPACGKCNQSKGNKEWKTWMGSEARLPPRKRGIPNLDQKMRRIEAFEQEFQPKVHDFSSIVGTQLWHQHWENWRRIVDEMKTAQILAAKINLKIKDATEAEQVLKA